MAPSGSSGGSERSVNQAPQRNGADAGPSGASSSSSWKEDSFEMQVLAEPFPDQEQREALRSAIHTLILEQVREYCDKGKGQPSACPDSQLSYR